MQLHAIEQRSLNRQVAMARPLLILLALVSLLLLGAPFGAAHEFLCAYLVVSVFVAVAQNFEWGRTWRFPLTADIVALAAFLMITPSVVPLWFLLLIVAFAVGVGWGGQRAYGIVGVLTLATLAWSLLRNNSADTGTNSGMMAEVLRAAEVACGTLVSGLGMAYLGDRNRQQAAESHFLAGLAAKLRVEAGVAESLRGLLNELRPAICHGLFDNFISYNCKTRDLENAPYVASCRELGFVKWLDSWEKVSVSKI
jgi:hypothetical protein